MSCPSAGGNWNALLDLYFGEADEGAAAALRAHVGECAHCGEYLATLAAVAGALGSWPDEAPPAGMAARIVAATLKRPQPRSAFDRPQAAVRPTTSALPLLALLPVMAALAAGIRAMAAWLPGLPFWPRLDEWPLLVQPLVPLAAATACVLALGGVAALAVAPALMLETRR